MQDNIKSLSPLKSVHIPPILDTNEQVDNIDKVNSLPPPLNTNVLNWKIKKMMQRDATISPLLDYANIIGSKNLEEYIAAFMCGKKLNQTDNLYLKQDSYCGSRLCPICSNIRTAKVLERYEGVLSMQNRNGWVFLTLTSSNDDINFSVDGLNNRIRKDDKIINQINKKLKYLGMDTDAIISFEVVPEGWKRSNDDSNIRYANAHPHYHILCRIATAEFIKKEWLHTHPEATAINQKIKKIQPENFEKSLREIIKYSIKPFLPKLRAHEGNILNVKGIDDIVTLMKGKRRLKTWGVFYDTKIAKIDKEDIDKLDLQKQPYANLPVKDKGELVEAKNYKGEVIGLIPSFTREVVYELKKVNELFNYYYLDNAELIPLTSYNPNDKVLKKGKLVKPKTYIPPVVYVGKELFTTWKKREDIKRKIFFNSIMSIDNEITF